MTTTIEAARAMIETSKKALAEPRAGFPDQFAFLKATEPEDVARVAEALLELVECLRETHSDECPNRGRDSEDCHPCALLARLDSEAST